MVRHKKSEYSGTASEMTPGGAELSKDAGSREGLEVTHQLVRRAEAKLVGLHSNRSQLRRRIRALHYLLKTLETMFSSFDSSDQGLHAPAQESKFNHDESSEFEKNSDTAVNSRTVVREKAISNPGVEENPTELRRACRIALMESDRPQCCEQILQRIRRRESVCVDGFDDPVIAIAQELSEMLTDGEVISNKNNELWQLNRHPD